jgi:hypothetical protein
MHPPSSFNLHPFPRWCPSKTLQYTTPTNQKQEKPENILKAILGDLEKGSTNVAGEGLNNIMDRIDFDSRVQSDGFIRIPDEYIAGLAKKEVHITVLSDGSDQNKVKFMPVRDVNLTKVDALPPGLRRTRLVERMIEHPFYDPDFKPLTREEIYDRGQTGKQ